MTELGRFPPDVMREAEYWWRKDACATPNANLYARAILAERERAARIAERHGDGGLEYDLEPEATVATSVASKSIAAAIRKGSEK